MKKNLALILTAIMLIFGVLFFFVNGNPSAGRSNLMTVEDKKIGDGVVAKAGDTVEVNYVGTFEDGKEFDSNNSFKFTLGIGEVIKGWDNGVEGMKAGGIRKLTIPSDLAYGARGVPGVIPGGATLIFNVELLAINP